MKQRGFTLIELLVVISIIGVLSVIMFASFSGIQQKSRDGQRKSDLRQIQAALELYRADNGYYPFAGQGPTANCSYCVNDMSNGTVCQPTSADLTVQLSKYLTTMPTDPSLPSNACTASSGYIQYVYLSTLNGNSCISGTPCNGYYLLATLENQNDPSLNTAKAQSILGSWSVTGTANYIVQNP